METSISFFQNNIIIFQWIAAFLFYPVFVYAVPVAIMLFQQKRLFEARVLSTSILLVLFIMIFRIFTVWIPLFLGFLFVQFVFSLIGDKDE
jgi:hypothetical protein